MEKSYVQEKDMQMLSIMPSVDNELRVIFDAIAQMYRNMERAFFSQHNLTFRNLCLSIMGNMRRIYQQNMPYTTERIDFSYPITQWSYMYVYMLRHVHLIFSSLDRALQEGIFHRNPIFQPPSVCMIGGGPGSDILGIALFMMKHGVTTTPLSRRVHVLDRCPAWCQSWWRLHQCLPEKYRKGIPTAQYHLFDYLENKLTSEQVWCIHDADIVTMIKSLSPAAAWLASKQKSYTEMKGTNGQMKRLIYEWHSVYEILQAMKPGAYLLYIDNETGPQRQILMDTVKNLNFDVLFDRVLRDVRMPNNIFSVSGCQFINAFNYKPCTMAGTNGVIILKKTISP